MLRLVALSIALIVILAIVTVLIAFLWFRGDIDRDVERLVSSAETPASSTIAEAILAGLPAPAQRYFHFAGVIGKPVPRLIRLTQRGRIRSSNEASWMTFEADETYSTSPPAFVWRAYMPSTVMPVVLGRDEYLEGNGSILMKMAGLLPVADEHGDELGAAGLMRYLNEAMWFPAALLLPNVTITPGDDTTFNVRITDRGMSAEATLSIDADGRLTNFRAQRYNTGSRSMETWETPITKYGEFNGLQLPARGAAVWRLATGDLQYIELDILSVTYQ